MGNWSSHFPAATSAAASWMAWAMSLSMILRRALTMAAAPLIAASAPMRARSMCSPEIGKFSTARCVCAAHLASAGTLTSPIESCSMRHESVMNGTVVSGAAVAPIGGPPLLSALAMHPNTRRRVPRPRLRLLTALALTLVAPILMAAPATADPIAAKKAQAERLARQIDEKGQKVSVLAEQVNQARLRADGLTARMRQAQAAMVEADVHLSATRKALRQQALDTYVRGASATIRVNPAVVDFNIAVQKTYVSSMA